MQILREENIFFHFHFLFLIDHWFSLLNVNESFAFVIHKSSQFITRKRENTRFRRISSLPFNFSLFFNLLSHNLISRWRALLLFNLRSSNGYGGELCQTKTLNSNYFFSVYHSRRETYTWTPYHESPIYVRV